MPPVASMEQRTPARIQRRSDQGDMVVKNQRAWWQDNSLGVPTKEHLEVGREVMRCTTQRHNNSDLGGAYGWAVV